MPNIRTKDYDGNDVVLRNATKVYYKSATSETLVPFTYGEAISRTIVPEFTNGGNMSVPIGDGQLVTEITINRPSNLLPENIKEGEFIAGVGPGTYVGAGGSEKLTPVMSYGTFTPSQKEETVSVTHNLGVIPDEIIIIICDKTLKGEARPSGIRHLIAYSGALKNAAGLSYAQRAETVFVGEQVNSMSGTYIEPLESNAYPQFVHDANESVFYITGYLFFTFSPNFEYSWYAIGGLMPH